MNEISKLLATDGFITVNKVLIKKLGLHEAVLLGELCAEYNYWEANNKLENDMFYSTRENIEDNTGLSEHFQRKALTSLKECGIISIVKKGLPAVNYYKINFESILSTLTTSRANYEALDVENFNLNNNKEKNNNIEINNSKELLQEQKRLIEKPKKKNLYQKCSDMIMDYTEDEKLRTVLGLYLKMRLEIRDKPIYANMWKGLLSKLSSLSDTVEGKLEIVQQSLDRGYLSFFPISQYSKKSFSDSSNDFKHENYYSDERYMEKEQKLREERERNGQKTKF